MLFQFRDAPFKRVQPFFDPCVGVTTRDHFSGQYLRETSNPLLEIGKSLINLALKAIEILAEIPPFLADLLKKPQRMIFRFGHDWSLSRAPRRYALSAAG
jgi:hypothetical protein